jgi:hypothetical protein
MSFKVDDWVRLVRLEGASTPVLRIDSFDGIDYIVNGMKCTKSDLVHWRPKREEWCWFYSDVMKLDNVCILRKFTQMEKDIEADDMFGCEPTVPDKEEFESIKVFYKYCEPFIGQLPSFIKE